MTEWMVTFNVGGSFTREAVRAHALDWAKRALDSVRPAIVFAQEVPSDEWLSAWDDAGYNVTLGHDRQWKVRSALITRDDLAITPITPGEFPNLDYHGNYVAAARWGSPLGEVLLASVHASPSRAEPDRYGWSGDLPVARDGGGDARYAGGQLWDSDLLLTTLRDLSRSGTESLLAAGDLNEALGYDLGGGTWGQEYFDRSREYGLEPWLYGAWNGERVTRANLQLDHVLASSPALVFLSNTPPPVIDKAWALEEPEGGRSDHAPVWVALADEAFQT